jgi:hypothetical protein
MRVWRRGWEVWEVWGGVGCVGVWVCVGLSGVLKKLLFLTIYFTLYKLLLLILYTI